MAVSVYTVWQINSYIKNMFTQDYLLSAVSVKGEVSNCKYHSSGHIYFTLKDKQSVISCVMFAGSRRGLSFSLQEGMQVIVHGRVDTYERDGKYQLYASKITQDGLGALYEKFLKIKEELEEEGLFSEEYKRPIPKDCRVLGVVTANTGAAIRDIISVAKKRDPYISIILYPAIVQGEHAADSIVKGIKALEGFGVDTIIVGRGGGSIEDLWAFNEVKVAQAIFDSSVPIISAVGHETDTTIADYVADARAETPTAAAQMASRDVESIIRMLSSYEERLNSLMGKRLDMAKLKSMKLEAQIKRYSPKSQIQEKRFFIIQAEDRLSIAIKSQIEAKKNALALMAGALHGLSPLEKLSQGYSFTESSSGKSISSVLDVSVGDDISIFVKDGSIEAKVLNTNKQE